MEKIDRREFSKSLMAISVMASLPNVAFSLNRKLEEIPVRAISKGPKFHWFGYYDKLQFDPSDRYVLSNEVGFEGRSPNADDKINIGMIDLKDNDKWIELGESHSFGWQQGCMLQWIPTMESKIIWNDRKGDHFISRILDVKSGKTEILPKPIYTVSPNGKWALGADFARIQNMRPGYGYKGVTDPFKKEKAPKDSGIYKMNLKNGKSQQLISIAQLADIPHEGKSIKNNWHYVNHLLINPESKRFIFLHRWKQDKGGIPGGRFTTRMFTADMNGNDLYMLDPSGNTSHFIWRDASHVAMFTKPIDKEAGFWLMKDKTAWKEQIGEGIMTQNGHNTYLPHTNNEWILNDTYPQRNTREQIPYLFHVPSKRKIELGRFKSPVEYQGEWRCDTHPRSSRSGSKVCIDSAHGGNGRQLYLIDIEHLTSVMRRR